MFTKNLQEDFLKEISKDEFIKEQNKNREILNIAQNFCLNFDLGEDTESYIYLFLCAFKLAIYFFIILLVLIPYLIEVLPLLIFVASLKSITDTLILSIILIDSFFAIFSLLGARGKFVCCCLYHPSNWILLMSIFDFVCLILDIVITYIGINGPEEYKDLSCIALHILLVIYNLFRQIGFYVKFKDIYKKLRELETTVIKKCVEELLKEEAY